MAIVLISQVGRWLLLKERRGLWLSEKAAETEVDFVRLLVRGGVQIVGPAVLNLESLDHVNRILTKAMYFSGN